MAFGSGILKEAGETNMATYMEFFARYAERYMAGDAPAVADMYTAPSIAVRDGAPIYLADRSAVVEHLAGLMTGYARAGAARADIAGIEILSQGDGAMLATVHWIVRSAAGDVIRDFKTSYQLVGRDTRWSIVSYVNHDLMEPA